MLLKEAAAARAERGTVPNPPIQPQTEGGNILTALRWRGTGGGLGDGKKGEEWEEKEGER